MVGGEGVTGKGEGEGENGGGRVGGAMEKYRLLWSLPPPLRRHRAPLLHPSLPRPSPTTTALGGGGGGGGTTASVGGSPSPPPPSPPSPFLSDACGIRPPSQPVPTTAREWTRLPIPGGGNKACNFWFRMCSVIGITEKKKSFRRWYYISMVTVIINDGITIWI